VRLVKNQKIFLKLCDKCKEHAHSLRVTVQVSYEEMCFECQGKIMQCVRLLTSGNLQPSAVVISMTEIPDTKELARTCRTDLLLLIEELRGDQR
jgi:hypothetical protein